MCLSPITINRKNDTVQQFYKSRFDCKDTSRFLHDNKAELNSWSRLKRYGLQPYLVDSITVPCGKCTECLKRRQNDLAVRCVREAEKRGSMAFVTLTYDDNSLPLACSLQKFDTDTGDMVYKSEPSLLVRYKGIGKSVSEGERAFVDVARGMILSQKAGRLSRRVLLDAPFNIEKGFHYSYEITPSLNRRDPRLWIKRCRVRYKREFGIDCPDFSYVLVGEYGPNTSRPHYHCCFFGLDRKTVDYFASLWDYGFTNVKIVNAINKDGSSGFRLASKYVGKYMVKGRFDCDCVHDGVSEKPRLCISRGVGKELDDKIIFYYRCYDYFGSYDIDTGKLSSGEYLTDTQLKVLFNGVKSRNFITIDGCKYSLPNVITKQIWYVPSEKTPGSLRCSTIRRYFSRFMASDVFTDYLRKQTEDYSIPVTESDFLAASEFVLSSESIASLQEKTNEQTYRSFYNQSIF